MHRRSFLVSAPATIAAALSACATGAGAQADNASEASVDLRIAETAATAAAAFLDGLSPEQRARALYAADDPALRSWFYFPSRRDRSGVPFEDLAASQRDAAFRLAAAVLSRRGYDQFRGIIAAEDELGRRNGEAHVNSGRYFIAVFGSPSVTDRFTVQINGHHLAINTTFTGGEVSPTPAFTGCDPVEIDVDGRRVRPMLAKTEAHAALLATLSETERAAARIGPVDDVRVGTGASDQYPRPVGAIVADLGPRAQERVMEVVRAWTGDAPDAVAQRLARRYAADLGRTRLAWTGSADPDRPGAYLRLDGPRLWLEFSNVGRFGNGDNHYHSVFRDKQADYLGTV